MINKILIFGTLPPPIGGVTISLKNLFKALSTKNVDVFLFSMIEVLTFKKYDVGHIHYLKRWKILIAIIISKLFCKKTILTYHGVDFYPEKSLNDKLILKLVDGIIVLNNELYKKCKNYTGNVIKLTPIFKEGVEIKTSEHSYFKKEYNQKYLLLYAFDKVYTNGIEVYGCIFILKLLSTLPDNIKLVFVDPKGAYYNDISTDISNRIIYFNEYVNFTNLLENVDVYLRPTNFDGNSVATLESISLNTPVLASDAVERNEAINLYLTNNEKDFILKLMNILENTKKNDINFNINTVNEYLNFCETLK